jgi:hypothetical protein
MSSRIASVLFEDFVCHYKDDCRAQNLPWSVKDAATALQDHLVEMGVLPSEAREFVQRWQRSHSDSQPT